MQNRVETEYVASMLDYLPTMMELMGATNPLPSWPIDGTSLLPYLRGEVTTRASPLGWFSISPWVTVPPETPTSSCGDRPVQAPPSYNTSWATPFGQPQAAWAEGLYKLFGCDPGAGKAWRWSLYDIGKDMVEGPAQDLWPTLGDTLGDTLYVHLYEWTANVLQSITTESGCTE